MQVEGLELVVGARNRTYSIPIPFLESISEPIPESESATQSELVPESELTWETQLVQVTESEMTPELELAPEWELVLEFRSEASEAKSVRISMRIDRVQVNFDSLLLSICSIIGPKSLEMTKPPNSDFGADS